MTIHVEDLKFECIIGILDFERVAPQDVIINLTLEYEYKNEFIDYALIVQMLKEAMIEKKFLLIEDALSYIESHLIQKYPFIKNSTIKITKPSILRDCKVSVSTNYKSQS